MAETMILAQPHPGWPSFVGRKTMSRCSLTRQAEPSSWPPVAIAVGFGKLFATTRTCPGCRAGGIIDGDVRAFRHDRWADGRTVESRGIGWTSQPAGQVPVEETGHDETDEDETENDDQPGIEHQL